MLRTPDPRSAACFACLALLLLSLAGPAFSDTRNWTFVAASRTSDTISLATMELLGKRGTPESPWIQLPSAVEYADLRPGKGEPARPGQLMRFHVKAFRPDGALLADTLAYRETVNYMLGTRKLPAEVEEALKDMRAGGRRVIIVPPQFSLIPNDTGNADPLNRPVFYWHKRPPRPGEVVLLEISMLWIRDDELRKTTRFE